jgi:hypothetical protein
MNNFDSANFKFLFKFFTKMANKVTKMCMDIYRKLEKSGVLNIRDGLQFPDILEICY